VEGDFKKRGLELFVALLLVLAPLDFPTMLLLLLLLLVILLLLLLDDGVVVVVVVAVVEFASFKDGEGEAVDG
jgi:hypothetical protein